MPNAIKIRGVSGGVDAVSVQSTVNATFALLGRKWHGLQFKVHEVTIQRDELVVIKCQGSDAVIQIEATDTEFGTTIAHGPATPTIPMRKGQRQKYSLRNGQALCLRTASMTYPLKSAGTITRV
jgi:hypothetical protein